jgi:hypothetical protein
MKKSRWVLFLFCLPWALTISWPFIGLCLLFKLAEKPRWGHFGVLSAVWREKIAKKWGYSTTIGSAVVYMPDMRSDDPKSPTRIDKHEDVHVRQYEDNMLLGFLAMILLGALFGCWWGGLLIWWSAGIWQALSYLTAGFRWGWSQEAMYRNAEHERSAYAQTDVTSRKEMSWEDEQSTGV